MWKHKNVKVKVKHRRHAQGTRGWSCGTNHTHMFSVTPKLTTHDLTSEKVSRTTSSFTCAAIHSVITQVFQIVSSSFTTTASSTSRAGLWCTDVGSPSSAPSPTCHGLTHWSAYAGKTQLRLHPLMKTGHFYAAIWHQATRRWSNCEEHRRFCNETSEHCFSSWCVTSCSKRSSVRGSSSRMQRCSTCSIAWLGHLPPAQPSAPHSITKTCRFPLRFWRLVSV